MGSRYFLENPTQSLDRANGIVQLDGVGGGEGYYLSTQGIWSATACCSVGFKTQVT